MTRSILIDSNGEIIRFIDEDGTSSKLQPSEPRDINLTTTKLLKELKDIDNIGEWKLLNAKCFGGDNKTILGVKTLHSGEIAYQVVFIDDEEVFDIFHTITEKIIDIFGFGIILLSSDGMVIFSNQRVKEILGLPPFINIISTNLFMSKTITESGLSGEIENSIKSGNSKNIELELVNFSGRKKELSALINPIHFRKSNYILLIIEDRIEKKKSIFESGEFLTNINELYKYITRSLQSDDPLSIIKEGITNILNISGLDNGLLLRQYRNKLAKVYQFKKSSELEEILSNTIFTEGLIERVSNRNQLLITDLELLLPSHFFSIKNGLLVKKYQIDNHSYIFLLTSLESKDEDTNTLSLVENLIDIVFFFYSKCLSNLSERFEIKLNDIKKSVLSHLKDDTDKKYILNIFNEKLFEEFEPVFSSIYLRVGDKLVPESTLVRDDISEYIKFIDINNTDEEFKYVNINLSSCPYNIIEYKENERLECKDIMMTIVNLSEGVSSNGLIIMGFEHQLPKGWVEFIERSYLEISSILSTVCSYYDIKESKYEVDIKDRLVRDLSSISSMDDLLNKIRETLNTDILVYKSEGDVFNILTELELNQSNFQKEIESIIPQASTEKLIERCRLINKEDLEVLNSKFELLNIRMGMLIQSEYSGNLVLLWQEKATDKFNDSILLNISELISRIMEMIERERQIKSRCEILKTLAELKISDMDKSLFKLSVPILANLIEKFLAINNLCLVFTTDENPLVEYGSGIFNILENPEMIDKVIDFAEGVKFEVKEITAILEPSDNPFMNTDYLYIFKVPYIKSQNFIIIAKYKQLKRCSVFTMEGIANELSRILT